MIWYGILATILLGAVLIMLGNITKSSQDEIDAVPVAQEKTLESEIAYLEKELENKLVENLSQMAGVGKVQVSVVLESGLRSNFAYNNSITKKVSTETDKSGGKREIEEVTENKQIVMGNSSVQPVIVYEERPVVAGVFVVAEGANDPKIKENIHNAIKTLLNIAPDKIAVYPMVGGK